MSNTVLYNQIKLAFPPINAKTFSVLRKNKDFKRALEYSHLYIICQRKELYFKKFEYITKASAVRFEIFNPDIDYSLKCYLPLFQDTLATDNRKAVGLAFEIGDEEKFDLNYRKDPVTIVNIIEIQRDGGISVLFKMSPEVFIYNFLRKNINAEVEGDLEGFLKYKVHYVGKATEQNICERLAGHSTFQDILSLETSMYYKDIPSNEITLLLFEVEDNFVILSEGKNDGVNLMDELLNYELPSFKELSLDAEKMLIRAMNPKYNQVKFTTYPRKTDLINTTIHDYIIYRLFDPITLKYKNGEIRGRINIELSDPIYIKK